MSDSAEVTAYVTKWALSKGILTVKGTPIAHGFLEWFDRSGVMHITAEEYWSTDPFIAIEQAELLRSVKLKALSAQIKRVQSRSFVLNINGGQ